MRVHCHTEEAKRRGLVLYRGRGRHLCYHSDSSGAFKEVKKEETDDNIGGVFRSDTGA